ncbi:MAG: alkylphosphonate utilization protein [Alcaligenaceae bacterium]|nr:alkylphosphonate utilization protein [Alcaligenaceae bacterium]
MSFPPCPQCASELTYNDGIQLVCPECGNEWLEGEATQADTEKVVKDSNGTVLQDGDTVTLIKDLKIKGSSQVIKQGTKVKNIRIVEGDHDIACKIDGSNMMLKSEFLKKV